MEITVKYYFIIAKTVDMLSDLGKGLNPKNQLSKYDTGVRNTITDYSMKSPFSMLLNVKVLYLKTDHAKRSVSI